ncbi:PREDICTED: probable purine permease 9 isoform X2 [Nicotiana attenuata]|uniref:probable purine permease 9 isoform X2 n=1 Tax=Nicotiana attenuata TaxID=49451 RepID=UPI0009054D62|nr:PREDICTED: probable purine permease 9 isoform X2 [Nicotiana attenuata]
MGDSSVVVQSQVQGNEAKIEESSQNGTDQSKAPSFVQYKWWIQMVIYSTFVLSGQSIGLPIAPVLAVIFLKDKLTGVKVMSMLLAIWGFVSYIYQHYLDDLKDKAAKDVEVVELSEVSLIERS